MSYVSVPQMLGLGASDPTVVALQNQINGVLTANGIAAITVDGLIGPKTCAAALQTASYDGGAILNSAVSANLCTSAGKPVAVAPKPVVKSSAPSSSLAPSSSSSSTIFGMSLQTVGIIAVGALVAVKFLGKKKAAS